MTPEQCHDVHCNSHKLREVLDGTDTQVATYTIDKWTAKMKEAEEYITREISRRGKGQFGRHQKALVVQYQRRRRRTHPRTRPEDGLWPPQIRHWRSCSPTILPDHWRNPRKGPVLKPASLPNSLYWACWVWVCSHLQWKTPPKSELYKNYLRINNLGHMAQNWNYNLEF